MKLAYLSASRINLYLTCPRKYAFRYVEGVQPAWKAAALAFGSAVHSALETYHRSFMEGGALTASEVAGLFVADWQAAQLDPLHFNAREDAVSLRRLGETLVTEYVSMHPSLPVRAVEWEFQLPLADPETGEVLGPDLRGVFDLVLEGDVIVEMKTAARAYDASTLARNLQLTAYHYAYRSLYGRTPKLRLVAMLKQKAARVETYEPERTNPEDTWFVHLAAAVAQGIEAEVFPPSPGWMCSDCEYMHACAAWRFAPAPTLHPALPILAAAVTP